MKGVMIDYSTIQTKYFITTATDITRKHMLFIIGDYEHLHIHYHNKSMFLIFILDENKNIYVNINEREFKRGTTNFIKVLEDHLGILLCLNYHKYTSMKPTFNTEDLNGELIYMDIQVYNALNNLIGNTLEYKKEIVI